MQKPLDKALKLLNSGKAKQAMPILQKLNRNQKNRTFMSLQVEAFCCLDLKLQEKAKHLLQSALKLAKSPLHIGNTYYNLALIEKEKRQHKKSADLLVEAIDTNPQDPDIFDWKLELANQYFLSNQFLLSQETLTPLLMSAKHELMAAELKVKIALKLSDYKQNLLYQKKLADNFDRLSPDKGLWLLQQIDIHGRIDICPLLDQAETLGLNSQTLALFRARLEVKGGRKQEALSILDSIVVDKLADQYTIRSFYNLKGKLLDEIGQYDQAFTQFQSMNLVAKKACVKRLNTKFDQRYDAKNFEFDKGPSNFEAPINLAFLVGFPRSGTTLLEQIIDTQPNILSIGEKPIINTLEEKIKKDGYENIGSLSNDYLDTLRRNYFELARQYTNSSDYSDYQLLLDKNPLQLMQLPLILRLFPNAKVLLTLRHPLDAILSCYMQNFNDELTSFMEMESSFRYYKDLFDLYRYFKQQLCWQEHSLKYEDLVVDMDNQMALLMKFFGIQADKNAFKNFNELAKRKVITTASVDQVKQGLYKSASGRWRNYFKYLEPHLPLIQNHIQKFGYSVDY